MTVALVPLQQIEGSCWFGGDALACALDKMTAAFGGPGVFGLLVGAVLFAALYIASDGDLTAPTVALVLGGTVLIPMVPGGYQSIGSAIVLIGLASALWQVMQKYVLRGATQ